MTTNNQPALQPPETLRMQWCPECGRDDRIQPLKTFHYRGGEICRGIPIKVEYTRARVRDGGVANHALIQLLNAALLHPENAEGYIRQVIGSLSDGEVATVGVYAPSSRREVLRLLDAIEQSIRGLSQPLGPMETATRIKIAADYGLIYVAALRERLSTDYATTAPVAAGVERESVKEESR